MDDEYINNPLLERFDLNYYKQFIIYTTMPELVYQIEDKSQYIDRIFNKYIEVQQGQEENIINKAIGNSIDPIQNWVGKSVEQSQKLKDKVFDLWGKDQMKGHWSISQFMKYDDINVKDPQLVNHALDRINYAVTETPLIIASIGSQMLWNKYNAAPTKQKSSSNAFLDLFKFNKGGTDKTPLQNIDDYQKKIQDYDRQQDLAKIKAPSSWDKVQGFMLNMVDLPLSFIQRESSLKTAIQQIVDTSFIKMNRLTQLYFDRYTTYEQKQQLFYVDNNAKVQMRGNIPFTIPQKLQILLNALDEMPGVYIDEEIFNAGTQFLLNDTERFNQYMQQRYGQAYADLYFLINDNIDSYVNNAVALQDLNTYLENQENVLFNNNVSFPMQDEQKTPEFRVSKMDIGSYGLNQQADNQNNATTPNNVYLVPKDTINVQQDLIQPFQNDMISTTTQRYQDNQNLLANLFSTPSNNFSHLSSNNFMGGDVNNGFSDFNLLSNINNPAYAESYRQTQQEVYNQSARFNIGVGQKGL